MGRLVFLAGVVCFLFASVDPGAEREMSRAPLPSSHRTIRTHLQVRADDQPHSHRERHREAAVRTLNGKIEIVDS